MEPINFEEANAALGKPEGWKDEDCQTLPVWKGLMKTPSGIDMPVVISRWMLDKNDLELINETSEVWLSVCGGGMPPVVITVSDPFK